MANELKSLDFLVGNWKADSVDPSGVKVTRTIQYEWSFNDHFLVAESSRQTGNTTVAMRITYFWDPTQQKARAWVLSSDGTWNEATVDISPGSITLHSRGALPSGQTISGTSVLTSTGPDSRTEEWRDIALDGHPQPSPAPILWQRS
jgi:hypothetical protein